MVKRACGFVVFRKRRSTDDGKVNVEYLLLQANKGKHHWSPPKGII